MNQTSKLFTLAIILLQLAGSSFGQQNNNLIRPCSLTAKNINKICSDIDSNKHLGESIEEGENELKKWGEETYRLQDAQGKKLYRITHNVSTKEYRKTIFYYHNKNVIKAIITITGKDMASPKYSATFYFNNCKLIKKVGGKRIYLNYKDILKEGFDFQYQFYKVNRRTKRRTSVALTKTD